MNKQHLQQKLRGIHSLITSLLYPTKPGDPTPTERTEEADQFLTDLEAEVAGVKEPEVGTDQELKNVDPRAPGAMGEAGPGPRPVKGTAIPDYDAQMVAAFELGFGANVNLWDAQQQRHYQLPDAKTRLETAKLYLAYRLGMPAQMILKIDGSSFKDRTQELIEIASTPSGRQLLLQMGAITPEWLAKNVPDSLKSASRQDS